MKPIVFLQPAEQEMLEAAQYYEYRRSGLGSRFLKIHRVHHNQANKKSVYFANPLYSLSIDWFGFK